MNSSKEKEHFVTLFDSNFLPIGMTLHSSLMKYAQPFHLWILCMDQLVEAQLGELLLPNVTLIPLREVETREQLNVKLDRTAAEYCWTLTPFTPQYVFERDSRVQRVTYLDADLFFFDDPQIIFKEFSQSGKQVLITDHNYAPEYEQSLKRGRFCVQFMTFTKSKGALKVMKWWQARCIEWCFARAEDGKFGDQMYLDSWPTLFASEIHVLSQPEMALAPWNVSYLLGINHSAIKPVFFHFHGFRVVSTNRMLMYRGYKISHSGQRIYSEYADAVEANLIIIYQKWKTIPVLVERDSYLDNVKRFIFKFLNRIQYRFFEL